MPRLTNRSASGGSPRRCRTPHAMRLRPLPSDPAESAGARSRGREAAQPCGCAVSQRWRGEVEIVLGRDARAPGRERGGQHPHLQGPSGVGAGDLTGGVQDDPPPHLRRADVPLDPARSESMSAPNTGSPDPSRAAPDRARARAPLPASQAPFAAANSRPARAPAELLSSAARSEAALAASWPPRRVARSATASKSSATASSSTPALASAACQVARSRSPAASRAARARCACCRCEVVAAAYTADRTSGCRSRRSSPRTRTRPERSAVSRAMSPAPSRVAARRMIDSRPESSAVRVPPPAARLDGPDGPEEKERTQMFSRIPCVLNGRPLQATCVR